MMRGFLINSLVGTSLLLFTAGAQAQVPRYEPPTPQYAPYGQADFQDGQALFRQVRTDLDRAQNNVYGDGEDHYVFDRVRGELSDLQRSWDENEYSPRQVDNVARALQQLLGNNHLLLRDRDMLTSDLSRLRDFRESHQY